MISSLSLFQRTLTPRTPEDVVGLLKNELKLTMAYLQNHPKVYWIWNHRKWCLEHVPLGPAVESSESGGQGGVSGQEDKLETPREGAGDVKEEMTEGWRIGFWKGELAVIEALLDADPRNCMSTKLPLGSFHVLSGSLSIDRRTDK